MKVLLFCLLLTSILYSSDLQTVYIDRYPSSATVEIKGQNLTHIGDTILLPEGFHTVVTNFKNDSRKSSIEVRLGKPNTFKLTASRPRFVISGGWINSFNEHRYSGIELQMGIHYHKNYWGVLAIGSGNEKTGVYDTVIVEEQYLKDTTTTEPWFAFNGIGLLYQRYDILPFKYLKF